MLYTLNQLTIYACDKGRYSKLQVCRRVRRCSNLSRHRALFRLPCFLSISCLLMAYPQTRLHYFKLLRIQTCIQTRPLYVDRHNRLDGHRNLKVGMHTCQMTGAWQTKTIRIHSSISRHKGYLHNRAGTYTCQFNNNPRISNRHTIGLQDWATQSMYVVQPYRPLVCAVPTHIDKAQLQYSS